MAITLVNSRNTTATTISINVTMPTNTLGNLILVLLSSENGIPAYGTPTGWTPISLGFTPATTPATLTAFYKFSNGSEPSTVTFTQASAKRQAAVSASFSGVDPTNPIDAALFTNSGSSGVTSYAAPNVTLSVPNDYLVRVWASINSGLGTVTPPSGTTAIGNAQSNASVYVVGEIKTTSGLSGASTASWTGAPRAGGATIALKPLVSATGQIKVYNGSSFIAKPLKVWNGSAWVTKPLKRWNGSAWVATNY